MPEGSEPISRPTRPAPPQLPQCEAPTPVVDCKSDPAKGCATCQAAPNALKCATCITAGYLVNDAGVVSSAGGECTFLYHMLTGEPRLLRHKRLWVLSGAWPSYARRCHLLLAACFYPFRTDAAHLVLSDAHLSLSIACSARCPLSTTAWPMLPRGAPRASLHPTS